MHKNINILLIIFNYSIFNLLSLINNFTIIHLKYNINVVQIL